MNTHLDDIATAVMILVCSVPAPVLLVAALVSIL